MTSDPAAARPEHLAPTGFIDSDHPAVRAYAERVTAGAADDRERAARLFAAVRDDLRYDPYSLSQQAEDYRASTVLQSGKGWCVPKAVVLTAVARAAGIPARIGFADVRNHLQSERLAALMDGDVFIYHGYTELLVDGAWRKATPAFNAELCARFGVEPLAFDGHADALLHAYDGRGEEYMEYLADRGVHDDLPLDEILGALRERYPALMTDLGTVRDPAFQA